jgi:PAS domain S-box-containing protein
MKSARQHGRAVIALGILLACCRCASALDPALDVSQYAHTSWKIREGFATGFIQDIAQTSDGYLWLATESGLLRFDGVRTVPWEPPNGEHLPSIDIRGLIAARDGTLWLGTAKGLASWKDGKLTHYPELDGHDVAALLQDRQGTIWAAGVVWEAGLSQPGKLCAIRGGAIECYGADGTFSFGVTALHEDSRGNLWLGAGNGLWRWRPGPPDHYALAERKHSALAGLIFNHNALIEGEHGDLLVAGLGGIAELIDGKLKEYSFPSGAPRFNEGGTLLRDRNGGLWIGTLDRGILHVHQGRTDVFAQSDGLSSNAVKCLFEDREGNIWVSTTAGLDLFREYAIPTISVKQGLSSPLVVCVLAARDGSVWLGTSDGLNRWKDGQVTVYRKRSAATAAQSNDAITAADRASAKHASAIVQQIALPGNYIDSLFQDAQGRIWVSAHEGIGYDGLGYFQNGRFTPFTAPHLTFVIPITADSSGNIWTTSSDGGLCRFRVGKPVECIPWPKLGLRGSFSDSLVIDPAGGGWLGFWNGGVVYFKDGAVRASYGRANGLGGGRVNALKLDPDGTLWAATDGGLSRIKDGNVATLTSKNGLPCDTIHDLIDDDTDSSWLYTACGLARVARSELDAWAVDPQRRVQAKVFDSSDGIRSHAGVDYPAPRVAKTADGRLWFLPLDGVSVVDPRHLAYNKVPPPVHIEKITADRKTYWQNLSGDASSAPPRLPPRVRDLAIDYTALSLVAPEKIHFRFKLEGQDQDWREVVNDREVQYSNLAPGNYRFRVAACNNSGVWNEAGDTLDFSIAPAYYQTNWFRLACVAAFLTLLWALYQIRVRSIEQRSEQMALMNAKLEAEIAERKRAEDARRRSQAYLTEAQSLSHTGSFGWKPSTGEIQWSEETCRIFQYDPTTKPTVQLVLERVHPEDRALTQQTIERASQEEKDFEHEYRLLMPDGAVKYLQIMAHALRDESGSIEFVGAVMDVTAAKQAEEKVRQSEAELYQLIDAIPQQVSVFDADWKPLFANQREREYTGLTLEEAQSKVPLARIFHPDDLKKLEALRKGMLSENVPSEIEARIRGKDGQYRWFLIRDNPLRDERGRILRWYGTRTDIEERKQAEEALHKAQAELAHVTRIMTMGELAASIAHEVNQPLSGVVVNGNACLRWLALDSPNLDEAREAVRRIVRDGKRAGDVIARVRALATKTDTAKERLDLNEAIREVAAFAGDELRKNRVAVRTEFGPDLLPVLGDRVQLQQVVLNLVMNGIEAMSSVEERPRELNIRTQNDDAGQVRVTVQDSGMGLDPEGMERMFDAFYTTKRGGMGMGLAISRSIIQNHGGKLWAVANEGPGMSVQFTIPKYQ